MPYGPVNRIELRRQDKDTVCRGKHFAFFNTNVINSIATYFSKRVFSLLSPCESNLPRCKVCLWHHLPYSLHQIIFCPEMTKQTRETWQRCVAERLTTGISCGYRKSTDVHA